VSCSNTSLALATNLSPRLNAPPKTLVGRKCRERPENKWPFQHFRGLIRIPRPAPRCVPDRNNPRFQRKVGRGWSAVGCRAADDEIFQVRRRLRFEQRDPVACRRPSTPRKLTGRARCCCGNIGRRFSGLLREHRRNGSDRHVWPKRFESLNPRDNLLKKAGSECTLHLAKDSHSV
jgi:hypothetical protein